MGSLLSLVPEWEDQDEITQHVQPLSMIIVSDAGCHDANGVYALISEEMGGRPVWASLGNPSYRIQWLVDKKIWALLLVGQDPMYFIQGRADYTFPCNPRWDHWKPSNGQLPCTSLQPLTNVIVYGAGNALINGVYIPCPFMDGGLPVWAHIGNEDCKIIWDDNLGTWMIDCSGESTYRMVNCTKKTFPRAAAWSTYIGGEAPSPKCLCTLRSNIVVKGAGIPEVDGLYVPCRDEHGGRPVWMLLGSDEYRIRWSKSFNVWILEYHQNTALYRIDNCSDCTPPAAAKWACFQGGVEPTPSIEYQAFCNITLSNARIANVNGVYGPIDEAVGGLPVWQKLGTGEYRIQWSSDAAMWVLRDAGCALYACKDIHYLRTENPGELMPESAHWIRCKSSLAAEEEEDHGLGFCMARSSNGSGYGKNKQIRREPSNHKQDRVESKQALEANATVGIVSTQTPRTNAEAWLEPQIRLDGSSDKTTAAKPGKTAISHPDNAGEEMPSLVEIPTTTDRACGILEQSTCSTEDVTRKYNIPYLKLPPHENLNPAVGVTTTDSTHGSVTSANSSIVASSNADTTAGRASLQKMRVLSGKPPPQPGQAKPAISSPVVSKQAGALTASSPLGAAPPGVPIVVATQGKMASPSHASQNPAELAKGKPSNLLVSNIGPPTKQFQMSQSYEVSTHLSRAKNLFSLQDESNVPPQFSSLKTMQRESKGGSMSLQRGAIIASNGTPNSSLSTTQITTPLGIATGLNKSTTMLPTALSVPTAGCFTASASGMQSPQMVTRPQSTQTLTTHQSTQTLNRPQSPQRGRLATPQSLTRSTSVLLSRSPALQAATSFIKPAATRTAGS